MPAPQKMILAQLAKMSFISKNIQLPMNWSEPGSQYPNAFKPEEKAVAPNSLMNLFREASLNKYHVDSAKTLSDQFSAYIDGICGAICDGIDKWMKMTVIAGAVINGPVGMLLPGGVIGPPLMPLIFGTAPKATPQELRYSMAISSAFGTQWMLWHMGLTGMLTYPAFAAFPGPMAPPTPNIPAPLITFSSGGEAGLSPGIMKSLMYGNLADPQALHAMDLFDSIATAFQPIFQIFKASTLVQSVLGMGPVPTFAPPFVPVGPVLGGTVIPTPGVLM